MAGVATPSTARGAGRCCAVAPPLEAVDGAEGEACGSFRLLRSFACGIEVRASAYVLTQVGQRRCRNGHQTKGMQGKLVWQQQRTRTTNQQRRITQQQRHESMCLTHVVASLL